MKDKIKDNQIYLSNGEVISLENYLDRVTDPLLQIIKGLKEELATFTNQEAGGEG